MNTNIYGDFEICISVPLKFKIFYSISFEYFFLKFFTATYFCHYKFFFFSHLLSHFGQILSWNLTTTYCLFCWLWYFLSLEKTAELKTEAATRRCSENMQQIYIIAPIPKCGFNKVALQLRHGCSPVSLLHVFRTPFPRNTSGWLLLLKAKFVNDNLFKVKKTVTWITWFAFLLLNLYAAFKKTFWVSVSFYSPTPFVKIEKSAPGIGKNTLLCSPMDYISHLVECLGEQIPKCFPAGLSFIFCR